METKTKRRLYRLWARLRGIKPWYFLILALISGIICVVALRANNLKMVELRTALYQADEQNGDVEGALRELRKQVYGHMNTGLSSGPQAVHPPIQLKSTYERLLAAKQAGAQSTASNSEDLYNQAQKYCEQAIPSGFSGSYRLSCIQSFVKQRTSGQSPAEDTSVPKALYQFDFLSPRWSPDLAGWSLVVSVLSLFGFVASLIFRRIMRRLVL